MLAANVIATSGRAVEAAGYVDVLLLDKTGTITLGNHQASKLLPLKGVTERQLADAPQLSSLADETPEGRSIVILAKQLFNLRERDLQTLNATFVPFSAMTRMSGVHVGDRVIRKGSADSIRRYLKTSHARLPAETEKLIEEVAHRGETPLVVVENQQILGVVALKDIIKGGIKERFAEMRRMGIKTVMITRDTFSIANDMAKYFAIIPTAFSITYPQLNILNIMQLYSSSLAILSTVIFNALIIVGLIPLALKSVSYHLMSAIALLRRNLWIYGFMD